MFDLFESMFFRGRSTQAEYFNAPDRTATGTAAAFRELDRINELFRFSHTFVSRFPEWLGKHRCRRLEIPDAKVSLYYGTRIVLQARKGTR